MKKTVFITGATSGIGKACAELLVMEGFRLILCGRRKARLQTLEQNLSKHTEVHTLAFDVRDRETVHHAIASLPRELSQIDVLINNAGNAHGLDYIQDGVLDDWEAMLDGNVKGLLYVSKALLPRMVDARSGHVINIGSLAAKEVYPKGNVYCASKHAVDALTIGMRKDLNAHGIRVGAVHPGLVETEFSDVRFKGDGSKADSVYEGYKALEARDVAEIVHFMISRPPHVNLADILVLPTAQASSTIINKKG